MDQIAKITNSSFTTVDSSHLSKKAYRFDIFKGKRDNLGKIHKIRSVGYAKIFENSVTYEIYLKTLLKDYFYLLPEKKEKSNADFMILTRELSSKPGRKYHWNAVGYAQILGGLNEGLMHLTWDLLYSNDIYLELTPKGNVADDTNSEFKNLNMAA